MIELIFVIVIIGILAAVAIPKLAATRDDAKISQIIANTKTAYRDMSSFYTAKGNLYWKDTATVNEVTNVELVTSCSSGQSTASVAGATLVLCDGKSTDAVTCVTMEVNETTVKVTAANLGGSIVCDGVVTDPAIISMAGGAGETKTHYLGGERVIR
ncbi:type II secretion system protein [Sulfurovum sp.]|uniref:type II secretion system protein n=1 Tax=Sulfurovum sp. TaxID=1969726 RepID=UPI0039C8C5DD